MIEIMQAHLATFLIIIFTVAVTPFYWFFVLPNKKAITMAWITAVGASIMITLVLFDVTKILGAVGEALIVFLWVIPPLIVWKKRSWFSGLDQRPIIGLQIFRVIGGLFILEMFRGHIPDSFAMPAGIGDIIVGGFALLLFVSYKKIPKSGIMALIAIGLADFTMAFFFGFTSFEGPAQLFAFGFDNQTNLFPTGVIPYFLVPYAITFHMISIINIKKTSN